MSERASERKKKRKTKTKKKNSLSLSPFNSLDAVLQHVPERVAVPAARRVEELGRALLALVCRCVHRQQVVDDGARADAHGLVERRRAPAVGDADVGSRLDEGLDGREDVLGRGDVEGGPVVVVACVGAGAGLEQPELIFFSKVEVLL